MDRRLFLSQTGAGVFGLSIRSLLTGLPPAFLMSGRALAAEATRKFAIIAQSGAGESVNGFGPGSFDSDAFIHPSTSDSDHTQTIAGVTYDADSLAQTTEFLSGPQPVRIAKVFESLGSMQDHITFFNYRTSLGIHPQMPIAQKAGGAIKGEIGRGEEELPSAIAQENAVGLGTLLDKPILLDGGATFRGAPLNRYSPTVIKELVSSSQGSEVPEGRYAAARNYLIDRIHKEVKANGTPNQKRFLDDHAISQQQASEVAGRLFSEVVDIEDDGYASQMRMAAILVKLRITPTVVVGYRLSGDNHVSDGLSVEAEETLNMMAAYRDFYDFATDMGVWNDLMYATLSVFGRSMDDRSNGRGHNGSLCTGLLFGGHLRRRVIGGIDPEEPKGVAVPLSSSTGGVENADVGIDDLHACYAKSVMKAVGITDDRLEVRVRDVPAVSLSS